MAGLALLLTSAACSGKDKESAAESGDSEASTPSLDDVQIIFNRSCVGTCHAGEAPAEGLDLSAGNAVGSLVGVPSVQVPTMMRVAPGDPDTSYLFHKMLGSQQNVGGSGTSMPPELRLSNDELEVVRLWILDGAPG